MAAQGKMIGIVAWSLVVVLLIGVGELAFLNRQQAKRAAGLCEALVQAGSTAGVAELSSESLKEAAALPDVLQKVQTAIQGVQQELATTKDALTASQAETFGARAEASALGTQAKEEKAKAETLAQDLAAKEAALAESQSLAEQAALEAKDALQAIEKQKADLEATVAGLKARMKAAKAELEAARQQAQELEAAATAETNPQAGADAGMNAATAEKPMPEPEVEEAPGRIIGQSDMISLIRYSEANQALSLQLLDGQSLSYQEVPVNAYDQLVNAGDKLDMIYRFKIQGTYKSIPPDSIVLRKYWKWMRRHPGSADVRVIETLIPPAAVAAPEAPLEIAPDAIPIGE